VHIKEDRINEEGLIRVTGIKMLPGAQPALHYGQFRFQINKTVQPPKCVVFISNQRKKEPSAICQSTP